MKNLIPSRYATAVYIGLIAIVCASVFGYIFNPVPDLNGDNCEYYKLATSLATGHGYTDIANIDLPPSKAFPPGYPLLMAGVRMFTDSIVAQKILNGFFLFGAALLFFLFIRRNMLPHTLALTASLILLLNYKVLEFATIMMSETSYLFFFALILWSLYRFDRRDETVPWWKNGWFWVLVLCAGYAFQIRTQGITAVAAVMVWMLATGKWRQALAFTAGFLLTTLPWMIRNRLAGLGSSRYLQEVMAVNIWRPEEGTVSFGELVIRGFDTLKMLITKAIPNTVIPYADVNYDAPATFGEWAAGLLLLGLAIYGFMQLGRYRWFLNAYTVAVVGIVCLWSAPSGNRYIVTLAPVLEIGLVVGLYHLLALAAKGLSLKQAPSPLWLLLPAVLLAGKPLKALSEKASLPLPPAYKNYYRIAETVKKELPGSVVCSRKPSLFYLYSQGYVCNYRYTQDDKELIRGLIESRTDYVVLEQLGYASTFRYLYPAIVANEHLFIPVMHLQNPDTYLFAFDRQAALRELGMDDRTSTDKVPQ